MTGVIFPADAATFTGDGLGRLPEVISGNVHEALNGIFEIVAKVPQTAVNANLLVEQNILWVKPSDVDAGQPFRIYRVTENAKDKTLTVYGRHITYDLSGIPVAPFSAVGVVPALNGLVTNALTDCPFSVWTDIDNTESAYGQTVPLSFRQCLGGVAGSILQRFGGEYEWDGMTVKLHAHRGANNGVSIRYGKNLTGFEIDRQAEAYTGCLAFYKAEDVVVTGTVQEITNPEDFPKKNVYILDCSTDFETVPTASELDTRARQYMTDNSFGVPFKDSLTVSFVALWQTEEYKNIAALERISLGDWVHVLYKDYDLLMEVVDVVYDWTNERYLSISLGNRKASLSQKVAEVAKGTQSEIIDETASILQSAIDHASDVLAGGTGGYIVIGRNANGQPNEIYIMDSPDAGTAVNVMRMNYAGIAFSQTGINGQYSTAWTIDSNFYADFITAGEFNGNLIRAGSILTSALEVAVQTVVEGIKMNFSFLSDGLHIAEKDESGAIVAAYQTLVSNLGLRVMDQSGNASLIAEGDSVTANNLTADKYLRLTMTNVSSRFQEYYSSVHQEQQGALFWEV